MKCPFCAIHFHDNWSTHELLRENSSTGWRYRTAVCPSGVCREMTIEMARLSTEQPEWQQVHPVGSNRGPTPREVPKEISTDYDEACQVLPVSPKASAALVRRCLQAMLHAHGYKDKDL